MFLSNYSMGALGYAIPGAIGAAVACPDHTIFALCGDGSFHFVTGELETISRLGLDIKIILFNNNVFGWIRGEMEHVYKAKQFATEFNQIDYSLIAKGFGITALDLQNPEKIPATLELALEKRGPVFIRIPVLSQDKLVSPIPRWIANAKEKSLPYLY